VYSNGTVKGEINCFAHGWTGVDAMYVKEYIKAWSERKQAALGRNWWEANLKVIGMNFGAF